MIALILSYCFSSNSSFFIISIFILKIIRKQRRFVGPGLEERELLASASNLFAAASFCLWTLEVAESDFPPESRMSQVSLCLADVINTSDSARDQG